MEETTRKTIFCTSCGAEFDINLPECPYCGTMNYIGAEAAYLEKLKDVREDLDDLQEVPMQEMKKEMKTQWSFVKKIIFRVGGVILAIVILAAACSYREKKKDEEIAAKTMQWLDENELIFDQLYQDKNYDEMFVKYQEATNDREDLLLYQWKYYSFMRTYERVLEGKEIIRMEEAGETLYEYNYCSLFYIEWIVYLEDGYDWKQLTTEQQEVIRGMSESLIKDFDSRWGCTNEEISKYKVYMKGNYGNMSYDKIEEIVQKWMEKQEDKG